MEIVEIVGALLWGGAIGFAFGRWPIPTSVVGAAALGLALIATSGEPSPPWDWPKTLVIGAGYFTGRMIEWRTRSEPESGDGQ